MPLLTSLSRGILTLMLNRPEKHNALDARSLDELHAALLDAQANEAVRVIVLTGAGATFCAGADISHMRSMRDASESDNLDDARRVAQCMRALDEVERPVIARVNGNVFGGGVGLVACCDIAVGVATAKFSLSEARLGLVPATISPYVIAAIGPRQARRLFVTAASFDAAEAHRLGLLHSVVSAESLDSAVDEIASQILLNGPQAVREAKRLVREVVGRADRDALSEETSQLLAKLRTGDEGKEGLSAFLEKRKPHWAK
jgi:methylglutaconyl-CoA hydratase